jgi:hypothetical protein
MASSAGPSDGPKPPPFPPPAHFTGGVPKPSQAPPPPKAVSPQQWLAEAEQMDELIATFKSRYPHFAFEDDPAQPWTFPKSAVWGGPGWQKRTATRLEAQYWRTKLRLLSHDAELYEAALKLTPHPFTPLTDPPNYVGMAISERRKELWRFAVSEETIKAADFQPEQYTMCIDGHMVQALVLTHETAKEVELDPYCVTALLPLRPLVSYGHEAKLEPPQTRGKGHCGGKDVVGSAWIDLLLPYCADPRHAPDTKFFIIEQDWRLYPEDLEVNFESPDGTGEYGSSSASTDVAPSSMPGPVRYQKLLSGEDPLDPTPELRDMLAMATAARKWTTPECPGGHGELIWGSWEPWIRCSVHYQWQVQADKRSTHPGVGNYVWMVTAACARKILVEVARALGL